MIDERKIATLRHAERSGVRRECTARDTMTRRQQVGGRQYCYSSPFYCRLFTRQYYCNPRSSIITAQASIGSKTI